MPSASLATREVVSGQTPTRTHSGRNAAYCTSSAAF